MQSKQNRNLKFQKFPQETTAALDSARTFSDGGELREGLMDERALNGEQVGLQDAVVTLP